jgi:hypothetical protein
MCVLLAAVYQIGVGSFGSRHSSTVNGRSWNENVETEHAFAVMVDV